MSLSRREVILTQLSLFRADHNILETGMKLLPSILESLEYAPITESELRGLITEIVLSRTMIALRVYQKEALQRGESFRWRQPRCRWFGSVLLILIQAGENDHQWRDFCYLFKHVYFICSHRSTLGGVISLILPVGSSESSPSDSDIRRFILNSHDGFAKESSHVVDDIIHFIHHETQKT